MILLWQKTPEHPKNNGVWIKFILDPDTIFPFLSLIFLNITTFNPHDIKPIHTLYQSDYYDDDRTTFNRKYQQQQHDDGNVKPTTMTPTY